MPDAIRHALAQRPGCGARRPGRPGRRARL